MMSWHDILKREVAASTVTAVAEKIGYKRTSLSLALHGNYPGDTKHIAAAIVETFSQEITCPHLKREIAPAECREMRDAPMPQSDPKKFRHWTVCRSCPNNPGKAPAKPVRKSQRRATP